MKVLVAGSNGFIGMNVTLYLLANKHEVIMTYRDDLTDVNLKALEKYKDQVFFEKGDLLDKELFQRLEKYQIDGIINAAIMTSKSFGELEDFSLMCNVNLRSNLNLMEFAIAQKVKKYIYVSSSGVYGSLSEPYDIVHEDSTLDLFNTYCITKYSSELLVSRMGELSGISTAIARIAAPYGPYERVTDGRVEMSVAYSMAHMAKEGEKAIIYGADVVRDWTYSKDTAKGICCLLMANKLNHKVYNVASGKNSSLRDIALAVKKANPKFEYEFTDKEEEANVGMSPDWQRGRLSIERLIEDTGFYTSYSLESGIADYIELLYQ